MSHGVSTTISYEHDGDGRTPVLVVAGELDAATSSDFATAVTSIIALEHPDRLIIDLAGVSFLDSMGLNELVRAHRSMHGRGGRLVLRSPGETTRVLLDVTRMTGHLEIE
jgi:anti-anti-sigma factor